MKLSEALLEATADERAEFFKPFERFGKIGTFAELLNAFENLAAFKTLRLAEEKNVSEQAAKDAARKSAFDVMVGASVPGLTESSDPRVTAYMALAEMERPDFLRKLLPAPMGSTQVSTVKTTTKSKLTEEEKKEINAKFALS